MKYFKPLTIAIAIFFTLLRANAQELSSKQDEKTGLYGFVNADDKYVVKPIYKEVDFDFGSKQGLFKVVTKNDKIGFVNENGKEVVPCKFDEAESFQNGYAVVKIKTAEYESKQGLLDSTGKEVVEVKYGRLEYYPKDMVVVFGETSTSEVGLMDVTGKVIIQPQYEFWSKTVSKGIWPVGKKDICGVVNLKNETIVPFEYQMIESFSDISNLAAAKKGGKYGFINRTGKVIIPFNYEDGWPTDSYLAVKKDGKWGLLSADGKTVLPTEYASISSAYKTTAWVKKNDSDELYEIDLATKQKVVKK